MPSSARSTPAPAPLAPGPAELVVEFAGVLRGTDQPVAAQARPFGVGQLVEIVTEQVDVPG